MEKIKFKFFLSIIFLINTTIIVIFFPDYAIELEPLFLAVFFGYFIIDTFTVIHPYFSDSVFSGKQFKKHFKARNQYKKDQLHQLISRNNTWAFIIFLLYFGGLSMIGLLYYYLPFFTTYHLYILFFIINTADYFCILFWCPFRSFFLKNKCCTTCRISNWDRFMKFYILIFVGNSYTTILFFMGLFVFLLWETLHFRHPERFYSISNQSLSCNVCTDNLCKNKE